MHEDLPAWSLLIGLAALVKVGRERRWVPRLLVWTGVKHEEAN